MLIEKQNIGNVIDKVVDFGKQIFASVLRSRTGALRELATLLRFQTGTKGFERQDKKLIPRMHELTDAYHDALLRALPDDGLVLGIIDDSSIKKTGEHFPKQQIHHDSSDNTFYSGMKALVSAIYRNEKFAAVASRLVGKEDNKLHVAEQHVMQLITDFLVDVFLFDSWYCKNPLIEFIDEQGKLFISRARCDTKAILDGEIRLDEFAKNIPHNEYEHIKVQGRSYWVKDVILQLKAYGELRVVISKESPYDEPIFLLTNAYQFSAQFVVKLYLKRFAIEVFFKDAKQFLNFETFLCRHPSSWNLHLLLTSILHWAIQTRKSISKKVRALREEIENCQLFINKNPRLTIFFDELRRKCQT